MSLCPWHLFRRSCYLPTLLPTSLTTAANASHLSGVPCHSLQSFASFACARRSIATTSSAMVAQGYKEAIEALNGLQTNAAVLQSIRAQGEDRSHTNIPATIKYLTRVGVTLEQLDALSIIHVTGTKGKGSTCAFTERLLREHGCRTGLYTSPHLVSVTERIRLDGQPLHQDEYTKYFWQVYNALYSQRDSPSDMPAYFKFLTVLALKVFIEEAVDVAVLEVGIGGEYDCTNVVRRPVVVGITSLDLDHTSLLGSSLASIAWHKAGIIKQGAALYTVPGHDARALRVIHERARDRQCEVQVVPPLHEYGWCRRPIYLGLAGEVQLLNASLALQLAHYWLRARQAVVAGVGKATATTRGPPATVGAVTANVEETSVTRSWNNLTGSRDDGAGDAIHSTTPSLTTPTTASVSSSSVDIPLTSSNVTAASDCIASSTRPTGQPDLDVSVVPPFTLSEEDLIALREVVWPGRSQVLRPNSRFTFYLDGAHTARSMEACSSWFEAVSTMHGRLLQQHPQHNHQSQHQNQSLQYQQLLHQYQNHELQNHLQQHGQLHHHQPSSQSRICRVLLFNSTGDRDVQALLRSLLKCHFHLVVFTTNMVTRDPKTSFDQINLTVSDQSQQLRCLKHLEAWQALRAKAPAVGAVASTSTGSHAASTGTRLPAAETGTSVPTDGVSTPAPAAGAGSAANAGAHGDVGLLTPLSSSTASLSPRTDSLTTSLQSDSCKLYPQNDQDNSLAVSSINCTRPSISLYNQVNQPLTNDPLQPCSHSSPVTLESWPLTTAALLDSTTTPVTNSSPISLDSSQNSCRTSSKSNSSRTSTSNLLTNSQVTAPPNSLDVTHMLQLTPLLGHWSTAGGEGELDEEEDSIRAVVVHYIQDALDWLYLSSRMTASELVAAEQVVNVPVRRDGAVVAEARRHATVYQLSDAGGGRSNNDVIGGGDDEEKIYQLLEQVGPLPRALLEADHVQVLVTGSLHLVGGVLAVLDPSLSSSKRPASALSHHLHHRYPCAPGAP